MAKRTKKETVLTLEEKLQQALVPVEEQPYPVPENWCWTKVGQLCKFIGGGTPSKNISDYWNGSIPWASVKDIKGDYLYDTVDYITEAGYKNSAANICEINDLILVTRIEPAKSIISKIETSINQDLKIVKSGLSSLFLHYYFKNFQHLFEMNSSGSTVKGITLSNIENTCFPLPPLPEQQRIVARIESLFAKLDEVKEKAQAVVDGYEDRKAAILHKAFTGELTAKWRKEHAGKYDISAWKEYKSSLVSSEDCPESIPNTWKWIRMGAVGYTNIGLTYSPKNVSNEGVIVLRSSNIQNGKMDYKDIVRVMMDIPDNKMCRKGDLLICARNGSKALVGKTAIVDSDGMSFGAFMAIFRSKYNPYIYYFLTSPFFRNLIDNEVGTTTINQVTQSILKNLSLPFAPPTEQCEIVRILKETISKEEEIKATAQSVLDQIDTMKKSILARAFRGELGTNDPSDEPAIELLKRVLQEE